MLQQTLKAVTTDVSKFAETLIADLDANKQNDQLRRNLQAEKEKKDIEVTQLQKEVLRLRARTKRLRDALEDESEDGHA